MRQLVTLLVLAALGFFAYDHYLKRGSEAVALSSVIQPFYDELFGQVNVARPVDLTPSLETIKERILDRQAQAQPEKRAVYERGIALLNGMLIMVKERNKTLEAALKGAKTKATLDGPNATSTTTGFFARVTIQRWEEAKMRQKPALDQMLNQLRLAENDWNKRLSSKVQAEDYNLPEYVPTLVKVDTTTPSRNTTQRPSSNPWGSSGYGPNSVSQGLQRRP